MADLIDRNSLGTGEASREVFNNPAYADGWNSAIQLIKDAPAVEVVQAEMLGCSLDSLFRGDGHV